MDLIVKTIQVISFALLFLAPMAVYGGDVLKVHGENTEALTVESGGAVAIGFEVTRELKNVTFEFNSLGLSSEGGIALNKEEIGPKSKITHTITAKKFAAKQKPGSVLKIDQLSPGRYFVVVWVDKGSVIFAGSGAGIKKEENGAKRLADLYAAKREPHAPMSEFEKLVKHGLHITVHESQ